MYFFYLGAWSRPEYLKECLLDIAGQKTVKALKR